MTQASSKWYDDLWEFWETAFRIHYPTYKSYEPTEQFIDVYGGVDAVVILEDDSEVSIQLKANKSNNLNNLPVHFAYINTQGRSCAFDKYFARNVELSFFFGYPYANAFLVVTYEEMKRFWLEHSTELKRTRSRSGKGKNKYIEISLGEFRKLLNPKRHSFYKL